MSLWPGFHDHVALFIGYDKKKACSWMEKYKMGQLRVKFSEVDIRKIMIKVR